MKVYRVKGTISAERVEEASRVMTTSSVAWANEGDYLVHDNGTVLVSKDEFERIYEEVSDEGDKEFHPAGKTVPQVLEFLDENPDQVERVKQDERDGGNRKGILEYEGK